MKVRSKADLRSALLRTLVLGVLFGLTFLQLEKTQSEAQWQNAFGKTTRYPLVNPLVMANIAIEHGHL